MNSEERTRAEQCEVFVRRFLEPSDETFMTTNNIIQSACRACGWIRVTEMNDWFRDAVKKVFGVSPTRDDSKHQRLAVKLNDDYARAKVWAIINNRPAIDFPEEKTPGRSVITRDMVIELSSLVVKCRTILTASLEQTQKIIKWTNHVEQELWDYCSKYDLKPEVGDNAPTD